MLVVGSRRWFMAAPAGFAMILLGAPKPLYAASPATIQRCGKPRYMTVRQLAPLARKWAKIRGIPASWIIATIKVESNGDACTRGDFVNKPGQLPYYRSLGLMQFNTAAHPDLMAEWGIKAVDLFDPDIAIMAGSYILARERDRIVKALQGRNPKTPVSVIVQLGYKGHMQKILRQLRAGTFDPLSIHGPAELARRSNALVEAEALV